MKLAISNIAWSEDEDETIGSVLCDTGAELLEVAPGRVHRDAVNATQAEVGDIREVWSSRGLPIASMQALLFGRPDLMLFGNEEEQAAFVNHIGAVIAFAGALGAGPLVFGSPGNRRKGEMAVDDAIGLAVPVFQKIGNLADAAGTVFCIEANATEYGCDFLTELADAARMVEACDHPAVGLIVDTGNMALAGEEPANAARFAGMARHLHLSRPHLAPLDEGDDYPRRVLNTMRDAGYDGIATVEMRRPETGASLAAARSVARARRWIDVS